MKKLSLDEIYECSLSIKSIYYNLHQLTSFKIQDYQVTYFIQKILETEKISLKELNHKVNFNDPQGIGLGFSFHKKGLKPKILFEKSITTFDYNFDYKNFVFELIQNYTIADQVGDPINSEFNLGDYFYSKSTWIGINSHLINLFSNLAKIEKQINASTIFVRNVFDQNLSQDVNIENFTRDYLNKKNIFKVDIQKLIELKHNVNNIIDGEINEFLKLSL